MRAEIEGRWGGGGEEAVAAAVEGQWDGSNGEEAKVQVSNLSSLCSPSHDPSFLSSLPVSALPPPPPTPPPPMPPPPLPAGSNSCGRKWRAKVSSHCSICTPARAPLSRLTPAHSSCSAPNYPRRCRVCSPLASAGRRSKGTVRPQKRKSHRMCCPSQCPGSNV